jgi:hypothetical protein
MMANQGSRAFAMVLSAYGLVDLIFGLLFSEIAISVSGEMIRRLRYLWHFPWQMNCGPLVFEAKFPFS